MFVDGSPKLRQDDTQLSLGLGRNGLLAQLTNAGLLGWTVASQRGNERGN